MPPLKLVIMRQKNGSLSDSLRTVENARIPVTLSNFCDFSPPITGGAYERLTIKAAGV